MSSSNSTNLNNQKHGFNNLKDSIAVLKEKSTTIKSNNNNNSSHDNIFQNIIDDIEKENKLKIPSFLKDFLNYSILLYLC